MSNPHALIDSDLVRARFAQDAMQLRADDEGNGTTLTGYFSTFGDWYEIDSWLEGQFMERFVKGAFARTISNNRSAMSVGFDHGLDPQIGDKPLGPIDVLREDSAGPYYEVPLLDTDYNRNFVLPALQGRTMDGRLRGSVLGASFRFRVIQDQWNEEPGRSAHNPEGIPERTITEARVFEFGPVVYPANSEATAGVRSMTDDLIARSAHRLGRARQDSPPAIGTGDTADPRKHSARTTTQLSREIARVRAEVERIPARTRK